MRKLKSPAPVRSPEERFWEKVKKTDGCWEFTGAKSHGYGIFSVGRKSEGDIGAHRFSFELHNGPVPSGMMVLHSCHNRACVRPDHLRAGTHAENMRDMVVAGRSLKGKLNGMHRPEVVALFKKNARRGEDRALSVLTNEKVLLVRKMRLDGATHQRIADVMGCSETCIRRVVSGKTWGHV